MQNGVHNDVNDDVGDGDIPFAFRPEGAGAGAEVAIAAEEAAAGPAPDNPYEVSWKHSFFIPGVLHIIHNCVEDRKPGETVTLDIFTRSGRSVRREA